ncbi:MAG: outer membrane lipoprotein carrier protein LolA [Leptospiraceae bacterium]|nr:outer membrane lipoprotein carrier protein LolA [Leptospiraceae bacterium]MDW7975024.1 outer membrane lipoprotein carrier protein LolA [Leptospiraceae bacterium]
MKKKVLFFVFLFGFSLYSNPPHNWMSHSMVVKEIIKTYESFENYRADFKIITKNRVSSGVAYYKKGGRVRFEFHQPAGDLLISDGKILWIVVGKQNLVGKQDLQLQVKNEDNKPIFAVMPGRGVSHLFQKYHYKFDDIQQPKEIDGKKYYVLDLEQKVKIGGYEKMKLFVNPKTFFIEKAIAEGSFGTKVTIEFSNIQTQLEIEGKLFQYQPPENARVVLNPLVSEE